MSQQPVERSSYQTGTAVQTIQPLAQGEGPPPGRPAARPRRSTRSILLIVGLLILSPLVGIGATLGILFANGQFSNTSQPQVSVNIPARSTAQPGSTPTPAAQTGQLPTPSSFQAINSSDSTTLGIVIKYPSDWTATPSQVSDGLLLEIHPPQQLGIDFFFEHYTDNASAQYASADQLNQTVFQQFSTSTSIHSFKANSTTGMPRTIGGTQWNEQDATFANNSGIQFSLITIAVKHHNAYYNIGFYAPSAAYNEAVQKYLQPMLDSFQFVS